MSTPKKNTTRGGAKSKEEVPKKHTESKVKMEEMPETEGWSKTSGTDLMSFTMADFANSFKLTDFDLGKFFDLFQFQGFNPAVMFEHLKALAFNATPKRSVNDFVDDMRKILAWYIIRGSKHNTSNSKKVSEEGAREIAKLAEIYQIKDSKPDKATTVTIARIAGVFAHVVAFLIHKSNPRLVRVLTSDGKQIDNLPRGLHFPSGASIIPKSEDYDKVFESWLEFQYSFSDLINSRNSEYDQKEAHEQARNYGNIMRNNSFFSEEDREKWMKMLGIVFE
jgi:hypothetical protein